jgi:hypothetical protein
MWINGREASYTVLSEFKTVRKLVGPIKMLLN